jgi:hypothetical protein
LAVQAVPIALRSRQVPPRPVQ